MNQIKNLIIVGDKQSKYIEYSYGDNTFELITDICILKDGAESESVNIFVTKPSGEKLQIESKKSKEIITYVYAIINEEDVDTNLNTITMLILNDMVNMKPIEKEEGKGVKKYTYWEYEWRRSKIVLIFMAIGAIIGMIVGISEMSQESEPEIFDYMTVNISSKFK